MNAENTAQRLQETAAKCLSSLDAWNKDLKDEEARESLLEAVHELRKVTSRLEIDIALNDRKALNSKPIPLPEHKSKMEKKKQKPLNEILPVAELREAGEKRRKIAIETKQNDDGDNDFDGDIEQNDDNAQEQKKSRKPRRKKREDN